MKKYCILLSCILLLSSCLTEKRVLNYLEENPHVIDQKTDTLYRIAKVPIHDTLYLPGDSLITDWTWDWGVNDDTTWTNESDGLIVEVVAKDIATVEPGSPHKKRTRFKVTTICKTDTLYLYDTLKITVPEIREKVVVKKQSAIPWFLLGALLLGIIIGIWQRGR